MYACNPNYFLKQVPPLLPFTEDKTETGTKIVEPEAPAEDAEQSVKD